MNKVIGKMALAAFFAAVSYFFAGCGRDDAAAQEIGEYTENKSTLIAEEKPSSASGADSKAEARKKGAAKREELERRREERLAEREARKEQRRKELGTGESPDGDGGKRLTKRQARRQEREKRRREEREAMRKRHESGQGPMTLEEREKSAKERYEQERAERENRGGGAAASVPPEDETPAEKKARIAKEQRELREAALEARREYEAMLGEDELPAYQRKSLSYWISKEQEKRRMREEAAKRRGESDVSTNPQKQETERKE